MFYAGAHAVGRCHTDRSGFWGPWSRAESTLSNEYFRLMFEEKWTEKKFSQLKAHDLDKVLFRSTNGGSIKLHVGGPDDRLGLKA